LFKDGEQKIPPKIAPNTPVGQVVVLVGGLQEA
jgi:hypothetical protein